MGVTTLDYYDILGTGDGIELRSGGVERLSGGADVSEMSVLIFKW